MTNIALQGAPNFRDIGGYKTAEGQSVLPNRIFRSDRLSSLTPADVAIVRSLGIRTVCDLRSAAESDLHPNRLPENWTGDQLHFSISADVRAQKNLFEPCIANPTELGARDVMTAIYRSFPQAFAPYFGRLCDSMAGGGLPMLIHCSAGKDRTGFVIAVLLSALDVPRETILADYLLSSEVSASKVTFDELKTLIASQIGRIPEDEIIRTILGVDQAYLQTAFGMIDEIYGSITAYLKDACGVGQQQICKLRAMLLSQFVPLSR